MNWGHKLLFFTILFMLFITGLVLYISTQHVELVENNYYEKGIRYQEVIDQKMNAEKFLSVSLDSNTGSIVIKPLEKFEKTAVSLLFYRPSDKSKDFSTHFELFDTLPLAYSYNLMDKGTWRLSVRWQNNNIPHLIEKEFILR
ncbi:MAG: FixH family protein [Bacteroidia bacterium]